MQYDVNNGLLQVVIDGEEINAVVGEAAQIDVGEAINYIQSGKAEIEEAVEEGITQFNENATEKTNEFDLNAQNKTSDFNSNATQKTLDFNSNASDKTSEFNLNAQDKTSDFNANAVEKTNDFNSNAQDKTGDFNDNAVDKTNDFNDNASDKTGDFNLNAQNKTSDFNDNYTEKKGLIDSQVVIAEGAATTATNQAGLAKQWAIGDPSEPVGNSSKYWAEYAESIAQTIGDPANKDLSNLSTAGNNRFVNLQQQIDAIVSSSDVFDIVADYAALQAYDITTVPVNDIIKVLVDSTHSDAATYYRCVSVGGVKSWSYIGSEGAYYTKGEADNKFSTITGTGSALDYTGTTLSLQNSSGTTLSSVTIQSSPGKNIANWSSNVTNCITEIPQDVKLELNNGTLTLKAGSKVYIPNGASFDTVTIASDISVTKQTNDKCFVFYYNNHLFVWEISGATSGTTAPSGTGTWYDTTNNIIRRYISGSQTAQGLSFPLAILDVNSTAIQAIDQVFNGFGYIGSTIFALPNVKGLIPNGRNADGTLKNISFEVSSVTTYTFDSKTSMDLAKVWINSTGQVGGLSSNIIYYEDINKVLYNVDNTQRLYCNSGIISISSGKITSLTPKTAFHAVDYNDFKEADDNNVKLTGNQSISGSKFLLNTLYFRKGGTYSDTPASVQMYGQLRFQDSTGKSTGVIDNYTTTDGTTHIRLYAYLPTDNSKYSIIDLSVDKNGNWNTYTLTPATSSNNNNIATTAFVKNQGYVSSANLATCHVVIETYVNGTSWYRVYDDGWVEQGGFITGSNNAFATATFLKAFSNTDYTIMCAMQGSTNADRFAQYNNKTTTSVGLYRDDYGTGIAWYACGYGA